MYVVITNTAICDIIGSILCQNGLEKAPDVVAKNEADDRAQA